MAVSDVDLANAALGLLLRDTIRDLDGSEPAAVRTKQYMQAAKEEVINEYDWYACRVVAPLIATTAPALRGWTLAYAMPSDAVCIWRVSDLKGNELEDFELGMSADVTLDTTYIFADTSGLAVRYGSRRASLSRFTPDVIDLMALKLAAKCCMTLNKDKQLLKYLKDEYKINLSAAKTKAANLEPEVQDLDFIPETISVRST